MQIPDDFRQLCLWFYQGSRDDFATYEEWIAYAVARVDGRQKEVIKKFLDELLSARHSDEEIAQTWRNSGPDYDFSKGGHRVFLIEVRRILEAPQV
jgi:phosphoserine phosphatase